MSVHPKHMAGDPRFGLLAEGVQFYTLESLGTQLCSNPEVTVTL